ncbi:MAG TPA: DNA polymerase domain-containing protein [Gemmatimonadaceae bacterium]|nr:DNA polymerase domain-containing protein [Gemmatimonadaceae bacterium]
MPETPASDEPTRRGDEWLWGWDATPGIVSVWAEDDGRAFVWRRLRETGALVREDTRFRPWMLLRFPDDIRHLGARLGHEGDANVDVTWRELAGPGELRYLVSAAELRTLTGAVLTGASRRLGRTVRHIRELADDDQVLVLPPDEQYLVATGRTYFRDLTFDDLRRLQFDLETTGLDARRDRMFMVSVRHPDGRAETLEAPTHDDAGEADLIRHLIATIDAADPDVIENHNLHGFDLPFLEERARRLRVPLALGRIGLPGLKQRGARRGSPSGRDDGRQIRFVAPGRELIDTMDAVRRYDHAVHELPGYGLKALARHFGISGPERELIPGAEIYDTYRRDPARVRRYALADVEEVAHLSRMLGGAAFALACMAPRRYERLADAGAATGVIDPLLVRAYLHDGMALPAHEHGDGTTHTGAALYLFASGVAQRVVKADVASLYPSLMRSFRIGPKRDHLGALLALVDRLVETRLAAKSAARAAPAGSAERHAHEAMSAAMKIVVNSAYGYLAAGGDLTRFADVHAANEVTRRGRETLGLMCRELAARGVTLLEGDTDGVYFAVPPHWTEADERRVVRDVASLLPPLVQLEFEGRYAAMLSHEPKNYALLRYDGTLTLTGVAFRSSRMEPFAVEFLRAAIARLLRGDVAGVRDAYLATLDAIRGRALGTYEMSSRVRLTKTPAEYLATRDARRELSYEAMLASGRTTWRAGERVRVYRTRNGGASVVAEQDDGAPPRDDPRDYDVDWYVRLLRETYAARMVRAFTVQDFAAVFPHPDQLSLFTPAIEGVRTILVGEPALAEVSPDSPG